METSALPKTIELPASPVGVRPRTVWRLRHPVWMAIGALCMAWATQWLVRWNLPLPQCLMRKFTGLPCPTCGCTRSLLAWSHLDLADAFAFNPLFSVFFVGTFGWFLLWFTGRIARRDLSGVCLRRARRLPLGRLLIVLAVLNWLYLCLNLPR